MRHESLTDESKGQLEDEQVVSPHAWVGLQHSLDELSRLPAARMDLRETLTLVAELAVRAVPGAEGAGLAMRNSRADHIVSTSDLVTAVDAAQYTLKQGPGISATHERRAVQSPALRVDSRWPVFGPHAAELGIHSALSLPLILPANVIGAITIYARPVLAFTDSSLHVGQLFATPAAIAVQHAAVSAHARLFADELHTVLTYRSVVDQAVGLMMSLHGTSADHAFAQLRSISADHHRSVHETAEEIVTSAVRRIVPRRATRS